MTEDPSGGATPARPSRTRPWAGGSVLMIGAGHMALGAVRYRDAFRDMLRDGYVASLRGNDLAPAAGLQRQRAFWFEMTGVALLLLGAQTTVLERRGVRPPRSTGWALAAAALAGGAALPVSGFWALLVPAGLIAVRRPADSAAVPAPRRDFAP